MSIRVVLIEDHHVFRIGLKYVFDHSDGIEVVGEAGDLATGLQAIRQTEANVVILDLDLPDASGVDLVQAIKSAVSDIAILVVSGQDGNDWAERVIRAGALGFVDKAAELREIVAAVRAVHAGRRLVSVSEQGKLTRQDAPVSGSIKRPDSAPLSNREREVLSRVARGLTNQQTADELFLSVKTVETYRSRLMRKLGITARSELFEYAREVGLLSPCTDSRS